MEAKRSPNVALRQAREARHLTQQQLAEAIATTPYSIHRWEKGLVVPSAYFRKKLCDFLGKTADELEFQPTLGVQATASYAPTLLAIDPPIWSVPYPRNPFFTGRETILAHVRHLLTQDHQMILTQPLALSGLGGIGKTQIALEYAYQYREEYHCVFWVNAATHDSLLADFVRIAKRLHLPQSHDPDHNQAQIAVKQWLATHHGWLLILDNADDVAMTRDFVPVELPGHLLLTSRAQALGPLAQRLDVSDMGIVEGMLLLLRRAKLLTVTETLEQVATDLIEVAEAIVIDLAFLPLALDQAGAYIDEIGCGLSTYQTLYRQRRKDLLQRRGSVPTDYPAAVATTWSLSFQQVEATNPAAADLLRLCAFCAPDTISEDLLAAGAAMLDAAMDDPLAINAAIEALRRFSFLYAHPAAQTFRIHRMVQVVLRDAMSPAQQSHWALMAVQATNATFPQQVVIETWPQCLRLLAQAQACAQLIQDYTIVTATAASLLERAALYLDAQALYPQAEHLLQQVLGILEVVVGKDHAQWAVALSNLANVDREQNRYAEAEAHYQQALAIQEARLGDAHLDVATTLQGLAYVYYDQWQYDQAEAMIRRALLIRERILGADHPDVALALARLANIYQRQRMFAQSEPLHLQALQIWEKALGADHPQLALSLQGLANIYSMQRKYDQAEKLYQRALQIWLSLLGPMHPRIALTYNNMGILYQAQEHYAQAESAYRQAVQIREAILGPEHLDVVHPLQGLAEVCLAQQHYEQAEVLLRRSLQIREQHLGVDHREVSYPLHELGNLYRLLKNDEAAAHYLRALTIRRQAMGSDHPEVAYPLYGLAQLYQQQGKYDQAERAYQDAITIRKQASAYEYQHPDTADILSDFAAFQQSQGNVAAALALYQEALSIQQATLGSEHPKTIKTTAALAKLRQDSQPT